MPTELGKTEVVLTERVFLGYGYFHIFANDKTGDEVPVEATQQEYEKLGGIDGSQFNPTLDGHTWKYSVGGAIKVDSPSGYMTDKEYTVISEKAYVMLKNKLGSGMAVPVTEIVADTVKIDTDKIVEEAEVIKP